MKNGLNIKDFGLLIKIILLFLSLIFWSNNSYSHTNGEKINAILKCADEAFSKTQRNNPKYVLEKILSKNNDYINSLITIKNLEKKSLTFKDDYMKKMGKYIKENPRPTKEMFHVDGKNTQEHFDAVDLWDSKKNDIWLRYMAEKENNSKNITKQKAKIKKLHEKEIQKILDKMSPKKKFTDDNYYLNYEKCEIKYNTVPTSFMFKYGD